MRVRLVSLIVVVAGCSGAARGAEPIPATGAVARPPGTVDAPSATASDVAWTAPAGVSSSRVSSPAPSAAPSPASSTRGGAATTPSPIAITPSTAPSGRPWFAALRADGTLEAWAKDGKRAVAPACAPAEVRVTYSAEGRGCEVTAIAATAANLWFAVRDGAKVSLRRLSLADGVVRDYAEAMPAGAQVDDLAVSPDDASVWLVAGSAGSSSGLLRIDGAAAPVTIADGATSVALDPSGSRLAVASGPQAGGTFIAIVDLPSGQRRDLAFAPADSPPYSLRHLTWSRDGRRLLFATEWEGQAMHVLDVETAARADQAVLASVDSGFGEQQACWGADGAVALGTWRYPYADEPPTPGDIVRWTSSARAGKHTGVRVFGQGYGGGMACRDDGAVALVDALPGATAREAGTVGDLLVIRTDGTTTRLGRGYLRVFAA